MREAIALMCLGLVADSLSAQATAQEPSPEPASIPIELARALIGGPFGDGDARMRFFVGAPSGGIPAAIVLPAGARIVGGVTSASGMSAIVEVAGPPATAIDSMTARMTRSGWTRPPMGPESGFIQAGPRGSGAMLCRDSTIVAIFPAGRATGGRYLSVSQRAGGRWDPCDPSVRSGRPVRELEIPPLQPPAGVRSLGGGGGGGGGDIRSATRLETTLDPVALIAHYAPQLRAAGWTVGSTAVSGDAAVAMVEARDPRGRPWRGMLTVLAWPSDSVRAVDLRMLRPDFR